MASERRRAWVPRLSSSRACLVPGWQVVSPPSFPPEVCLRTPMDVRPMQKVDLTSSLLALHAEALAEYFEVAVSNRPLFSCKSTSIGCWACFDFRLLDQKY